MYIVSFTNKYIVFDNSGNNIAEFGSSEDAKNFILNNEETTTENIKEYPFYEVDEHGQPIGN
jgi:hypothetical protein